MHPSSISGQHRQPTELIACVSTTACVVTDLLPNRHPCPVQRINHFYGMLELARKRPMARTVSALAAAAAAAAAAPPYPTLSAPSNLAPQLSAAAESAAAASSAVAAGCPTGGGPVPSLLLDFMPESWVLPQQLTAFLAAAQAGGRKVPFIVKPDAGCQVRHRGVVQLRDRT